MILVLSGRINEFTSSADSDPTDMAESTRVREQSGSLCPIVRAESLRSSEISSGITEEPCGLSSKLSIGDKHGARHGSTASAWSFAPRDIQLRRSAWRDS